MKRTLTLAMLLCMTACTYSITQVQTTGTASDVVDDTDTTSVKTDATANVPITPGI